MGSAGAKINQKHTKSAKTHQQLIKPHNTKEPDRTEKHNGDFATQRA